jgi:hypothetical protein
MLRKACTLVVDHCEPDRKIEERDKAKERRGPITCDTTVVIQSKSERSKRDSVIWLADAVNDRARWRCDSPDSNSADHLWESAHKHT